MLDRPFEPNCFTTCFDVTQGEDSSDPGAFQTHRPRGQTGSPTVTREVGSSVTRDVGSFGGIPVHWITTLGLYFIFCASPSRQMYIHSGAYTRTFDYIGNFPRVPGRMLDPGARQRPPIPPISSDTGTHYQVSAAV